MLAATFTPGFELTMIVGSSSHPGGGLLFSFGDNPILKEDANFGQTDANIEKLGKAPVLLNKLVHNMSNSSFSFKNKPTTTVAVSAASSRTGKPSKPPIKPVKVPKGKVSFVLNFSSVISNSSGYLEVKSQTPTWNSSLLVAVLALSAPPVLNNDASTSLLTGDSAKEARLRSIWDGQNENGPLFEGVCEVLLFKLGRGSLDKNPVGRPTLSEGDGVECLVMLPNADQHLERQQLDEEASWASSASSTNPKEASDPMRVAVTKDGRLRLLIMKPEARDFVRLTLLDFDTPSSHKFIIATYCSSVEGMCSSTDKDELVFFKITTHSVRRSQLQSGSSMASSISLSGGRGGADGQSGSKGKSIPASAKLLIHQPITSSSLCQPHKLTLAERFLKWVAVAIKASSRWSEWTLIQRQRRYPVFQLGPGGFVYESSCDNSSNSNSSVGTSTGKSEDGLYSHNARVFLLQQDKLSWDYNFFEISLPSGAGSLAHVHFRFVLSLWCTVPPEFHVFLLEQRSRTLLWSRGSILNLLGNTNSTSYSSSSSSINTGISSSKSTVAKEADNHINLNVGNPSPRCSIGSDSQGGPQVLYPVLMPEYLEAHDAVLLCGPYKLSPFMADSGTGSAAGSGSADWNSSGGGGQTAVLTLGGHQLLQSTTRNFMIHVKYIPSFTQSNSISLLNVSRPMTNSSGGFGGGSSAMGGSQHQRRTNQTNGCDWIQKVAISVQRFKPTTAPQERCSPLASSNSVGQFLEFAHKSKSQREHIMVLNILNWKTALHYAVPMIECRDNIISSAGNIAGNVVKIINRPRNLLDWFVIRVNWTTAQQTVQLIVSIHELAIQCVPEEDLLTMMKQLMFCLLQGLESLHTCSSSGVVHWYLVLLSRFYICGESEVAGPVWGVLKKIITELRRRKQPLQQLLQSRYGFYGRPFESDSLFDLDQNGASSGPSSRIVNKNGSIAASFAALHRQLVNGASTSAQQQQQQPGDGQRDKTHSHLESLSLKRSLDLLDVEPIPFGLASASDGVRLERSSDSTAAASHSQFTAVALNGLVEASKLSSSRADGTTPAPLPHLPTSHRWQHLLGTNPPLLIVMERLDSGGRKFAVLNFGSSILLTDVYIPTCADWTSIAVDAWSRTDRGKTCETVRLASSSDIIRRPLVLPDLQPPVVCRYIRSTVTGRQGLSSSNPPGSLLPLKTAFALVT